MPYVRRGEPAETPDAEPTAAASDAAPSEGDSLQPARTTKARKSIWIIGLAVGGYMIISGIVQLIMSGQG